MYSPHQAYLPERHLAVDSQMEDDLPQAVRNCYPCKRDLPRVEFYRKGFSEDVLQDLPYVSSFPTLPKTCRHVIPAAICA